MPKQTVFKLDLDRAYSLIQTIASTRIMVIGDLMIDEFIWGNVNRISPEAPVPVVSVRKQSFALGGAANVVNNIRALGGEVLVAGVVGKDVMGQQLIEEIKKSGAKPVAVIKDADRETTLKTRVVAHHQQVVRIDRETVAPLSPEIEARMMAAVEKNLAHCNALIIEDYAKGVINPKTLHNMIRLARKMGVFISVDPKVFYPDQYKSVQLLTPNHHEAGSFAGVAVPNGDSLMKIGKKLVKMLNGASILITRGEEGMSLFEANGEITHIPTRAKEVYDVSGAGDTVIGTMTAIIAAGGSIKEAAAISNYAAGVVVGKVGVATCSPEELKSAIKE